MTYHRRTTAEIIPIYPEGSRCPVENVLAAVCSLGNDQRQMLANRFNEIYADAPAVPLMLMVGKTGSGS